MFKKTKRNHVKTIPTVNCHAPHWISSSTFSRPVVSSPVDHVKEAEGYGSLVGGSSGVRHVRTERRKIYECADQPGRRAYIARQRRSVERSRSCTGNRRPKPNAHFLVTGHFNSIPVVYSAGNDTNVFHASRANV